MTDHPKNDHDKTRCLHCRVLDMIIADLEDDGSCDVELTIVMLSTVIAEISTSASLENGGEMDPTLPKFALAQLPAAYERLRVMGERVNTSPSTPRTTH